MQEWEKLMDAWGVEPGKTLADFCDFSGCKNNKNYHCKREKIEIDIHGICKSKTSRPFSEDEMKQIVEKSQKEPHVLKTINPYFSDVWAGIKTFDFRKNDRGFEKGDKIVLLEYDDQNDSLSGRRIEATVIYILQGLPPLPADHAILGIKRTSRIALLKEKKETE